jgi:hypothetical protein
VEVLDGIDDKLAHWLAEQPMFFVATAPLAADGHVNVSPKGMAGTFAVLGPRRVGYLDYYGSGSETIAHVRENGRITLMFAAFTGRPRIIRLYGQARILLAGDPAGERAAEFAELRPRFAKDRTVAQRSIVVVDLDRVQTSCGYSVPFLDFVADRTLLDLHQQKEGAAAYVDYGPRRNARSIDGLPAFSQD